jgi:hypothetical protein
MRLVSRSHVSAAFPRSTPTGRAPSVRHLVVEHVGQRGAEHAMRLPSLPRGPLFHASGLRQFGSSACAARQRPNA